MKKLFAAFALVGMLALTACNNDTTEENTPERTPSRFSITNTHHIQD